MAKVNRAKTKIKTRSGTEVDSATIDELAAEAERGYDLSKAKRRRVDPYENRRYPSRKISPVFRQENVAA